MSFEWKFGSDEEDNCDDRSITQTSTKDNNNELDTDDDRKPSATTTSDFSVTKLSKIHDSVDNDSMDSDCVTFVNWDEQSESECGSVDWEDAADGNEMQHSSATATKDELAPSAITVDLNDNGDATRSAESKVSKKGKKRMKHIYRSRSLPDALNSIIYNLHRSHVLALTSHAVYASSLSIIFPVIKALSYSLIPLDLVHHNFGSISSYKQSFPSTSQLTSFMNWFFDLIHNAEKRINNRLRRNRLAGAPARKRNKRQRSTSKKGNTDEKLFDTSNTQNDIDSSVAGRILRYIEYLSNSLSEDVQLLDSIKPDFQSFDCCLVLISMARSMGWRCRLVQAMNPIQLDLDVSHPVLANSMVNFFNVAFQKAAVDETFRLPKLSRKDSSQKQKAWENNEAKESSSAIMVWVEILSQSSDIQMSTSHHKWIHVDPVSRLVNKPEQVESLVADVWSEHKINSNSGAQRNQKQFPSQKNSLAYVVGIEHRSDRRVANWLDVSTHDDPFALLRLVDVTPRYAKSWISALKLRGNVRDRHCSIEDMTNNCWWSNTLREMNSTFKSKSNKPMILPRNFELVSTEIVVDGVGKACIDLTDIEEAVIVKETTKDTDDSSENSVDKSELKELEAIGSNEAIPTSKAAFKDHPIYVIPSVLRTTEVLAPDAKKRIVGVFKGELIYRRSDVSVALSAQKWLYSGRKVLNEEVNHPIKCLKARQKVPSKKFRALQSYGVGKENELNDGCRATELQASDIPGEDNQQRLYAKWQTEPWSPPYVNAFDPMPVNKHNNVELALLNRGLVHIDVKGIAPVAKRLEIPYAPCLIGFEGHYGNRVPSIRGIVVHAHNESILREAGVEVSNILLEEEYNERRKRICLRWKKLMTGLLTKERVEREYG